MDPRSGQVDMRVEESGNHGRPGEVNGSVRRWRIAGAHTLDVPAVDEQPLPHRGMRERVNAGHSVQGLHGAADYRRRSTPPPTESQTGAKSSASTIFVLFSASRRPISEAAVVSRSMIRCAWTSVSAPTKTSSTHRTWA